jgi:hypothetical protein
MVIVQGYLRSNRTGRADPRRNPADDRAAVLAPDRRKIKMLLDKA